MVGPAGCNRGNLGPVPATVARGFHGPPNTLLLALLRYYATQKRWPWNREGGGGQGQGPETMKAAARTAGPSGAGERGAITKRLSC